MESIMVCSEKTPVSRKILQPFLTKTIPNHLTNNLTMIDKEEAG